MHKFDLLIFSFFLGYEDIKDEELPLGFTFSFPMHQHALNSATLINWTINFKYANQG